ncbi:MAG TPA: ABC transporter permease/substrate-binding protein [Steroidobacteraceae bacterium]|nr:ABC transporter permease/substrate-binding protein [Steroidobacteraceae bacterium]
MHERFAAAARLLPDYLGQHVLLSAAALSLGFLISLPLVVLASRNARIRWPVLGFASVVQTVPSLALLALFYPLLLAVSAGWAKLFGHGFSALGFLPSLLALTLYSMLPILRNGITGLTNVDPAVIEAARGVGMTNRQRLLRIELPLAAPVIMAGVRTAAVWVIGGATLSTPVGQTSLGNYIFSGLQVEDWVSVLFGCLAAVVLALVADQLLGLIEVGVATRRPRLAWLGLGVLLAGVGAAGVGSLAASGQQAYVVGAKNFAEQYILAAVMTDRIHKAGSAATARVDLGSVFAFRALANNGIDAYIDYSGTVWTTVMNRHDSLPRKEMLREMAVQLRRAHGVVLLGALGFENAYALAMRRDQAEALGIRTIADLARHAPELRLGGDFEFFARSEWAALRDRYGLRFREQRQFQPTFLYKAVASKAVDVISAASSDGRIRAYDLVVLEDPLQVIPPYDAIVLISPARASDPVLLRALRPLVGAIPIDAMRQANYMVDRDSDRISPNQAARWLESEIHVN